MRKTAQLAHAERLLARAGGAAVALDKLWQTMPMVASGEVFSLLRKARDAAYADVHTWQQEVARVREAGKVSKKPAKK